MKDTQTRQRRGSPLLVLGIVMVAWAGGRAAIWENPFANLAESFPAFLAEDQSGSGESTQVLDNGPAGQDVAIAPPDTLAVGENVAFTNFATMSEMSGSFGRAGGRVGLLSSRPLGMAPQVAMGHRMLWSAALAHSPQGLSAQRQSFLPGLRPPPFAPAENGANDGVTVDRWSLDSWAFWRQGSNALPISQGRVPIYGASQIGASFQYRLAPRTRRDPRLYARAYRALVSNGESELSFGGSIRPVGAIPLRAHAEARLTNTISGTEVRPAAFAVTELSPQRLPAGLIAEAYGQGGYVGGKDATAFADGQVAITRPVQQFDLGDSKRARLSLGAGAWGGVQKDANRIDLGPTVRLDLTIGKVPARLSVDWREQVVGDAAPDSGVAATLSTRF